MEFLLVQTLLYIVIYVQTFMLPHYSAALWFPNRYGVILPNLKAIFLFELRKPQTPFILSCFSNLPLFFSISTLFVFPQSQSFLVLSLAFMISGLHRLSGGMDLQRLGETGSDGRPSPGPILASEALLIGIWACLRKVLIPLMCSPVRR